MSKERQVCQRMMFGRHGTIYCKVNAAFKIEYGSETTLFMCTEHADHYRDVAEVTLINPKLGVML